MGAITKNNLTNWIDIFLINAGLKLFTYVYLGCHYYFFSHSTMYFPISRLWVVQNKEFWYINSGYWLLLFLFTQNEEHIFVCILILICACFSKWGWFWRSFTESQIWFISGLKHKYFPLTSLWLLILYGTLALT